MATAGYSSKVYITTTDTNPTSSDLVVDAQSASLNASMADLDTSVMGEAFTKFILGKATHEIPISGLYNASDTGQTRIETAHTGRSSIWVHVDRTGSGSCVKVECKVPSFNISMDQGGVVTFEATIRSVGARGTSTVS